MSKRSSWSLALLVAARLVAVGGVATPAWAQDAPPSAQPAFDERGWFTCHGFLRLALPERHAYLIGLREGWQTSAGTLDAWAASTDVPDTHRIALDETAEWLRGRIDHGGVSYAEMLRRTGLVCERDPAVTVWKAWLDAIRVSARARAEESAEAAETPATP